MWVWALVWLVAQQAVAQDAASLRAAPHTLAVVVHEPASWDEGQGREAWTLSITSDGRQAWAVATVTTPTPVYRAKGFPGYQEMDWFPGTEDLVAWRRERVAVAYDLSDGRATVCDVVRNLRIRPDGVVLRGDTQSDYSDVALSVEPVWSLVWAALGDASITTHGLQSSRTGAAGEGIPLATHGEVRVGSDRVHEVDLVSFTPSYDPAVRASAEAARGEACGGRTPERDE